MKFKQWICSALLVVVSVAPPWLGRKDAADAKKPAETTRSCAASACCPAATVNPIPSGRGMAMSPPCWACW
jgi:hypothetical protein